jgi:hypothetical protein
MHNLIDSKGKLRGGKREEQKEIRGMCILFFFIQGSFNFLAHFILELVKCFNAMCESLGKIWLPEKWHKSCSAHIETWIICTHQLSFIVPSFTFLFQAGRLLKQHSI